ncbi:MAG TPA: four-carbon acid sugar kinase family protein [Roseiflexaceae bacterium]|nr:four-carbon acid sugar kinase family protein [Roseiflexaceae bacterium]
MAEPLLILADDLTGAGDSAARCRTAGLPAVVSLHPPPYDRQLAAGAVAFSSDSRHLPPALAAERVGAVVRPYAAMRAHWYKKIDSTLRGNLGSEIDALLDTLGRSRMLICPAFPAQQRTLHNGILLVGTTAFPERHLPTMLAHQSRRRVAHLPLQLVRSDNFAAALMAPDAELLVADALSDADLAGMVAAAAGQPALLLCGSAGLVSALAEQLVQSSAVPGGNWQIPAGPRLLASWEREQHRPSPACVSCRRS